MNVNKQPRYRGLRWVLGILGASALLVLVVVGVAYYSGWLLNIFLLTRQPEQSARYYPDDTLLYVWLTLNPGDGQREQMQSIWDELNEQPTFRAWRDDTEDLAMDEYDIDIEDDVLAWVGPEMSFAIKEVDIDESEIEAAITIDVRDADASKDFLLDWLDIQIEESGTAFDRRSTGDFDVWTNETNDDSYALSDRLLVISTDSRFLDEILERVESKEDGSLQEDEYFKAARATLPSRRFMSVYLSGKQGSYAIEDTAIGATLDSSFYDEFPDWAAASVGWVEDGIVLDLITPLTEEVASAFDGTQPLSNPARLVPSDTVAMLAFTFDPDVENWREALREYDLSELIEDMDEFDPPDFPSDIPFDPSNMNMAHMLDLGLMGFDIITGIDLERDFFAYLEGEMVLGVSEFDSEAVREDPEQNAVDAAALLAYTKDREPDLAETMEELLDWLDSVVDIDIDETDVGARSDAMVVELRDVDYSPGYVLHDGYLTVATTEVMLERIVRLQKGGSDNLAEDEEFRRAFSYLNEDPYIQIYLDLQSLVELGDIDESNLSKRQVRFLRDSLGSLAVVSTSDDNHERLQVALTLFPRTNATSVEVWSETQRNGRVARSTDIPIKEPARNSLSSPGSAVETEPTETTSPYKIGVMEAVTGPGKFYGNMAVQAKQMAVAEINAAGGVDGRMLEFVIEDSQCNAQDAIAAYKKLTDVDGIKIILGTSCSGAMLGAAPLAEGDGVILFSGLASNPDIANAGDYIFRTSMSDAQVGVDTGNLLWADGVRTLATITEATDYAEGVRRTSVEQFEKRGGQVVGEERYASDVTNFRFQITKLLNANPDGLHIAAQSEFSGGTIINHARELGYEGSIYSDVIPIGTTALEIAGDAATGMKAIIADLDPANGKGQDVLADFRERYGYIIFPWHLGSAYDDVYITAECLKQTEDDQDADGFRDCLYDVTWSGAIGNNYSFDENGEVVGLVNMVVEILPTPDRSEDNQGYRVLGPAPTR